MFDKVIKDMVEANSSVYTEFATSLTDAFSDELIQLMYYDNDNIEMLVGNLFIIPRFIEQLPIDRRLELLPILIGQLVEYLPLVVTMSLPIYDNELEDEQIVAELRQLYSTKDNLVVFNYFMTTLLAHISLTIIGDIAEEHKTFFNESDMLWLTRGKQICRCFFSSVDLLSLKSLPDFFFELIHDVTEAVNGYTVSGAIPHILQQVQQGIISLLHHEQFKHWFGEHCQGILQTHISDVTWVSKVINICTISEERPLINIWLRNPSLIMNMVELIISVHGHRYVYELLDVQKTGDYEMKHLSKIALGLQPFVHTEPKDVLIDFISMMCEKYSDREKKGPLIIIWFCIKLFLESDCIGIDKHRDSLAKSIIKLNHFKLTMAYCLALQVSDEEARCPNVKIVKKKCYADLLALKIISDTVMDVVPNWLHLFTRNWSVYEPVFYVFLAIEPHFFALYESHLIARVHYNAEVFSVLCQSITVLRRHYSDLLKSGKEDSALLEERLARCNGQVISALFGTRDLDGALQTIQSLASAEDLKTLLIIISYGALFQRVLGQFFSDKDIYNQEKYFDLLTAQLTNKKMVGPLLAWVNNDENYANSVCETLFFLLIVVTKPPGVVRGLHSFELDKWRNFTFSLIASIAEEESSVLRYVLLATIQSHKIFARLPLIYQKKLLKSLGGKQAPAIDLGELDNLLTLFEEKTLSTSKKKKNKKSKPVETPVEVVITDRALLDSMGSRMTVTSHLLDDDSALSDDLSNTTEDDLDHSTKCEPNLDEIALPLVKTRFDLLCESLQKLTKNLNKQIKQMESIELPPAWLIIVRQVKATMLLFQVKLKVPSTSIDAVQVVAYTGLSSPDKILLEQKWNQELAVFCSNVEREMAEYVIKSISDEASDESALLVQTTNELLLSLSGAYFKNLELHIKDDELILCLSLMSYFFKTKGYRMCIKGSYFAFPELAYDMDILLIPNDKMGSFNLERNIKELGKFLNREIYAGHIDQPDDVLFQKLSIKRANGLLIDIDLGILLHPLSAKDEQNRTASGFLTLCATHWYVDGHAVMLPKSAQGVCYKRPSLGLLKIFTAEDYLVLSGYLLKNIIKYGTQVRHDPLIKQFIDAYINPDTRTDNRQQVVSNALQYLFDRFESRTNQIISYLILNQLLQVVYPLDEPTWALCTTYFSAHFDPANNVPFPITPSSPTFLVMCFLGGMIDQTETHRSLFIARLEQLVASGPTQLKIALVILKGLPKQTNELFQHKLMYESDKQKYDLSPQHASSFKIKVILQILECWHLKDVRKVVPQAIQPQDVFVPVSAGSSAALSIRKEPQSPVFFKAVDPQAASSINAIGLTPNGGTGL